MNARRGRIIALSTGVLGIAVLATAGFALRERTCEQYWLWKLELGDESARWFAAQRLGEMRSSRAVPGLLKWVAGSKRKPEESGWYVW